MGLVLLGFAILSLTEISSSHRLNFTLLNSILPSPRSHVGAVYDGDDSIYILGGVLLPGVKKMTDEILKYTVSTDEISIIAHFPKPYAFWTNSVALKSNGKVVAFTSYNESSDVFEFDPVTKEIRKVLDLVPFSSLFLQVSPEKVIFVGQDTSSFWIDIVEVDLNTMVTTILNRHEGDHIRYGAFDRENNVIYFTGFLYDSWSATHRRVYKFDLGTNQIEKIYQEFQSDQTPSGTIWKDGKMFAFDAWLTDRSSEMVSVFDPHVPEFTFVPVDVQNGINEELTGRGMAYVEKLNRVYLFGGWNSSYFVSGIARDYIGFIELDTNSSFEETD